MKGKLGAIFGISLVLILVTGLVIAFTIDVTIGILICMISPLAILIYCEVSKKSQE